MTEETMTEETMTKEMTDAKRDPFLLDKTEARRIIAEADRAAGVPDDLDVTPQQVQEMMRAQGIRAEDNIFSRDIIRARYPDEDEDK